MRRFLVVALAAVVSLGALPAASHEQDLITAGGRVGPIRTGRTNISEMKDLFGDPSRRKVVRVGCSRVVRLTWRGQILAMSYRADEERRIVDVKVLAREVDTAEPGDTYVFHTRKGLRVGDSERRLRRLYTRYIDAHTHRGHTHYLLDESDRGTRLIAKVVDNEVVQLEAAPYEFC